LKLPVGPANFRLAITSFSNRWYALVWSGMAIVIEKDKIASGGSGAAGAFLSPKISSGSLYTAFINEAFEFSIKFYKDNFSEFLEQKGILRLLKMKTKF